MYENKYRLDMKQSNTLQKIQYLNYITGIPVLYKILKKNHNTGTNFYTSIVHNTSIPVLRSPTTGDPFGVICTFQSSQFFERLSMHFGVVDHIRAPALTTARGL
jgi:hypothetical protein